MKVLMDFGLISNLRVMVAASVYVLTAFIQKPYPAYQLIGLFALVVSSALVYFWWCGVVSLCQTACCSFSLK
jgi:hypothetical protein